MVEKLLEKVSSIARLTQLGLREELNTRSA